jgi:pimeloyl-ACP methyl ester carboxylesterase
MPHLTTDDGVKLYYEETGKGIPIVFIHEFAGDYRSWEQQVRYFARYYRCITVNARGYPPSDVPKDGAKYSQGRARDDIRSVLDALKIDKAHVVGLSMGGFATLHFGFTYPDRARSLVIAGCGYGAEPDKRAQFAAEAEASAKRFEELTMAKAAEAYALGPTRVQHQNRDPRGWREFADQFAEHSTEGAALTMRGVQAKRPSLFELVDKMKADHRADADHDRRRGLALHRAGRADEEDHLHRRAGGDAERRPQHQSGRPGGVQRASRRAVRRGRCRHLAHARPARDGGIDTGEVSAPSLRCRTTPAGDRAQTHRRHSARSAPRILR